MKPIKQLCLIALAFGFIGVLFPRLIDPGPSDEARAQGVGVLPPGHNLGNGTTSPRSPTDTRITSEIDVDVCATNNKVLLRLNGLWGCGNIAGNTAIWAGTANQLIDAAGAQSAIAPVTVTISGSTFTPSFTSAIDLELTLVHASCPCTVANPTGVYAGLNGFMTVIQSTSGSDLINTWGSTWKFPGGTHPTLSTSPSYIDTFGFYCRTTTFCELTTAGLGFQ